MTLEYRLEELLKNFRYESSLGLGRRALMKHHINALMGALTPFIKEEIKNCQKELVKRYFSTEVETPKSKSKGILRNF